eukprot:3858429-Rhodomonas_salina.1
MMLWANRPRGSARWTIIAPRHSLHRLPTVKLLVVASPLPLDRRRQWKSSVSDNHRPTTDPSPLLLLPELVAPNASPARSRLR